MENAGSYSTLEGGREIDEGDFVLSRKITQQSTATPTAWLLVQSSSEQGGRDFGKHGDWLITIWALPTSRSPSDGISSRGAL
jgi:hypothetical protein